MGLKEQIEADLKKAMLARDQDELRALRSIKSMILLAETEKGSKGVLTDEAGNSILMKAAKQRKESAEVFETQNRKDLSVKEIAEFEIISRYLPKQLSSEELKKELATIIQEAGATGPQDMGKVMGMASKALAGRADGKTIAETVRSLLSK